MARRNLLTRDERDRLFLPRTDHFSIIRNYTLASEDLAIIGKRRGAVNRLGIAAHLALLRHPGFGLRINTDVPEAVLNYLAAQLDLSPNAFETYGQRAQTRTDHGSTAAEYLGLQPFTRSDIAHAIELAARAAMLSDRGETIARFVMDSLKADRFILPLPDTLERSGLAGRARARKRAATEIVAELDGTKLELLDALLINDPALGMTPLAWLRDMPGSPSTKNMNALLKRLGYIRKLGIDPGISLATTGFRFGQFVREGSVAPPFLLADYSPNRRRATLAAIVACHTAHSLASVCGPGDTSSSDGQFFRAGGRGEARADHNARYGSEPGVLFYTHVTDQFTLFHTKVIAANAGEAANVLDGLLDHESGLVIREHATDTAGAVDHVFGLCHLLGFRFAPRIRDLNERRLYGLSPLDPWPTLRTLVAGPINVRAIEENWDETLRLAASIRAGTVSASAMLRKLAGYPRQNPVARALREIGRIERTLFMLDWFDDPEQRRRTGSILNKGEARNALARAIFFNRLGELRNRTFENQRHRASGLTLATAAVTMWNTVYLDRAVRHLRADGVAVPDELVAHVAPLGWEHIGLTGDYLWSEIDKPRDRFRPLGLQSS